jgi:hypothetical protein
VMHVLALVKRFTTQHVHVHAADRRNRLGPLDRPAFARAVAASREDCRDESTYRRANGPRRGSVGGWCERRTEKRRLLSPCRPMPKA